MISVRLPCMGIFVGCIILWNQMVATMACGVGGIRVERNCESVSPKWPFLGH